MSISRALPMALVVAVHLLFATVQATGSKRLPSLIFLRTGSGVAGEIIGVDDDSLTIVAASVQRIAKSDISHVVLRHPRPKGRGFVCGTIAGVIGVNLAFLTAKGQPAQFLDAGFYGGSHSGSGYHPIPLAVVAVVGTGIGGSIGHLIDDNIDYDEETIVPGATEEEQSAAWSRLRSGTAPTPQRDDRLRFALVSACVIPGMQDEFVSGTGNAGLSLAYESPYWNTGDLTTATSYERVEATQNINIVRRVQATYCLTPRIETGVSVAWLGEPVLFAQKNDPQHYRVQTGVRQVLSGNGYYAIGLYNPGEYIHPRIDMRLGGGVGLARVKYRLDAFTWNPEKQLFSTAVETTVFSGIVLAELSWRAYRNMSIGLAADYVIASTSQVLPAVEFAGLPERKFNPGNGSIGLTMSIHF